MFWFPLYPSPLPALPSSSCLSFSVFLCASPVYSLLTGVGERGGAKSYYTDKKENQIFLIYKEIHSEAVAKLFMKKGVLIYVEMRKYFPIYEKAVSHTVYDFATAPFWISLYMRKILFSFSSVSVLRESLYESFKKIWISRYLYTFVEASFCAEFWKTVGFRICLSNFIFYRLV